MITATDPATDADQRFWWDILSSGGATTIPRWARDPVPGVAEHRLSIPDDVVLGLWRLAGAAHVSRDSVALAAHARVLAVLSGESRVTTGYVARAGRPPVLCRLDTDVVSWRSLAVAADRAGSLAAVHGERPVEEWAARWSIPGPLFETVCDPTGDGGEPAGDVVLWVGVSLEVGRGCVALHYRSDALDADAAARVAGYHLAVFRLMATDPDAVPRTQSLLSADEVRRQLDEFAGPRRERPDRRVHELFEDRAAAFPDAVAAVRGDRSWTYGELNVRANQLARALRARGLDREDVVAVVTERNLDWMAAVLAVFKAGGVYLPVEPHFPADRVATMISRAGCRLVLTERGSDTALQASIGVQIVQIDQAYEERHATDDLGIAVAADQLAYIYFTSGSTGQPKGAMCEHAGLLNHVFAKIEDLGIDEHQVVAQTAPQCFDISLWQLVSPLLVGGRTVLVEQETILDVARFVETVVAARVTVLQLVPSYLEVVLSLLAQRPRELPDLRCVSVTGEAVKKPLTQRWFAQTRGIALVNAYGLTETSDDTNHEVMLGVPVQDRVPLGRPVPNVRISVVDERLDPVPLGSAGEIMFSGVCVGRGYVNDPERTRAAFVPDPHRPGERRYRSGDQGRWLPDGKLEFLGRRDTQVKIRGFRIEIGEIDNTLLRVPGVRDGAVVVSERAEGAQLVAFYTGPHVLPAEELRDRLAATLPTYMVPAAFHWRRDLPLTGNSKIDRKALTALAAEPAGASDERREPATPTERRLAAAWATVLGVPSSEIGRADHFFDLGGNSLSAVKLAVTLDREVGLPDITRHPVLTDLAQILDDRSAGRRVPDPRKES